jgi:hypothetical protein
MRVYDTPAGQGSPNLRLKGEKGRGFEWGAKDPKDAKDLKDGKDWKDGRVAARPLALSRAAIYGFSRSRQ